jgi:hypothetical protein
MGDHHIILRRRNMINKLDVQDWLKLNATLQKKKNALRKDLKERGILKREGSNNYDHYKYFSEAQYKELFTGLMADHGLELGFTELDYSTFEGTDKQANGRMPRLEFYLYDTETGFYETTVITGEAIDKGDKAGYKAYTGALKYYLANTFMVATGDNTEEESPDFKMNTKQERKASIKQISVLSKFYTGERLSKLLEMNNLEKLEDISMKKASELIGKLKEKEAENGE